MEHSFLSPQTIASEIIEGLEVKICQQLNCSEASHDLLKINHNRDVLTVKQQSVIFKHQSAANVIPSKITKPTSSQDNDSDVCETEEPYTEADSNDIWLGYFPGYEILTNETDIEMCTNKRCMILNHSVSSADLDYHLRSGVRCFVIDLFLGTALDNQKLVLNLKQSEMRISQEIGFPVLTSLIAQLSPRYQYTGMLEINNAEYQLSKNDILTLSIKREHSLRGSRERVYVNARFLLDDCELGNILLMGPTIQLQILEKGDDYLKCSVLEGGILQSRLPIRFPNKCKRFNMSHEEIEDILFAREMAINVIILPIYGTRKYLENISDCMSLLKCEHMRIWTCVILNQIEEFEDLHWVAENYDGFLIDFSTMQRGNVCIDQENNEEAGLLKLSTRAIAFTNKVYQLQKPIIMNATLIADRCLYVNPEYLQEIFYFPDKYICQGIAKDNISRFFIIQNTNFTKIQMEISREICAVQELDPFDIIAKSCALASLHGNVKAILLCSQQPEMGIKLSHFRPHMPIIYLSTLQSPSDYLSVYHHVIQLQFSHKKLYAPEYDLEFLTKSMIIGLYYIKSRKIINANDYVQLVIGKGPNTILSDKFILYKFGENFVQDVNNILSKNCEHLN